MAGIGNSLIISFLIGFVAFAIGAALIGLQSPVQDIRYAGILLVVLGGVTVLGIFIVIATGGYSNSGV